MNRRIWNWLLDLLQTITAGNSMESILPPDKVSKREESMYILQKYGLSALLERFKTTFFQKKKRKREEESVLTTYLQFIHLQIQERKKY